MKTDLKWIIMVIFVMKIDMLMMKNICYIMKLIVPLRGNAYAYMRLLRIKVSMIDNL